MKFGVLQFFGWLDRSIPIEQIYARALERIDIMETSGYDAVWLAEHHFSSYSVCPSVHLMAMHIASRTQRLRIGTAVTLAPLYHPLRIAEEVALLDILSGGRVNWGAGRGFDAREFDVFDVPVEQSTARFREAVEIVLRAWTQQRLSFEGQFHRYHDVEVLPKPRQQPHPPVWVAGTSDSAVAWAAKRGLALLMDPHSTPGVIAAKQQHYESIIATQNKTVRGADRPIARLIAVADTDEEARRVAERGAAFTANYVPPHVIATFREDQRQIDPLAHYLDDVIVCGSPTKVIDELQRLEETIPLKYLLLSPLSERTFSLFTEKVMPHVA